MLVIFPYGISLYPKTYASSLLNFAVKYQNGIFPVSLIQISQKFWQDLTKLKHSSSERSWNELWNSPPTTSKVLSFASPTPPPIWKAWGCSAIWRKRKKANRGLQLKWKYPNASNRRLEWRIKRKGCVPLGGFYPAILVTWNFYLSSYLKRTEMRPGRRKVPGFVVST